MKTALRSLRFAVLTIGVIIVIAIVFAVSNVPQSAQEKGLSGDLSTKFSQSDVITEDIRNAAKRFIRLSVETEADRAKATGFGRIVGDYGSFVVIAVDKGTSLKGSNLENQIVETSINLANGEFDPINEAPNGTVQSGESSGGNGYFIVQFGTTATDELIDSLKSAGLEVLQYVPNQAFFVYGSGLAVERVAGHSRVRWVGRLMPEHKISTVLLEQLNADKNGVLPNRGISPIEKIAANTAVFDVAVFERADLAAAADQISDEYGGTVLNKIDLPNNFFNIVRVEISVDKVEAISNIPDVFRIEAYGKPMGEDERSAQIVAGNFTGATMISGPGYNPLAQFGVDGTNVTISMADDGVSIPGNGGFYVTSGNTLNGPLRGATAGASGGHGHINASIIAGAAPFGVSDPTGHNYGLGIAPKSNIINLPFLKAGSTSTEADLYDDTVSTNGVNGVKGFISNNSWGNGLNGNTYDLYAASFDGFVRDASIAGTIDPILLVFSAGNSGSSGLTRPKVAKNLIATGSSENLRPEIGPTDANSLEDMSTFSSRGPAADTRVKPDIIAPGGAVAGSRAGDGTSISGNIDADHSYSNGTSHAAPQVAGAAALITQWWKAANGGANPSPALVKAAIINGGVNMTGVGASNPLPNGDEGWGRINLKNILNTGATNTYINETATLADSGNSRTYSGTVADGARPVRVTLVWTDPPGAADPPLVNNLNLQVTVGGITYRGNVFAAGISTTGGSADNRNNVENVFLPAGTAGPISVRVTATAINGDGVLGNGDATDQHFALVVFNGSVMPDASASLSTGTPSLPTGNAIIEPNECNTVNIPLTNNGETAATTISATLSTVTPGVTISAGDSAYASIAGSGGTQNNATPFQISTSEAVACGTTINLTLTVNYSGGGSPAVFSIPLLVGQPANPNYSFASSTGATIPPGGSLVAGSQADDLVVDIPLPAGFASTIYGISVTSLQADTNGNLRINAPGGTYSRNNQVLPTTGVSGQLLPNSPVLFALWDDWDLRTPQVTGGGIYTNTVGAPGNRQLIIEWRGEFFNEGTTAINANFAIVLTENSDTVRYIYTMTGADTHQNGATATVGVQAATTGSQFTQFSFNTASLSAGLQLAGTRASGVCSVGSASCGGDPTPTATPAGFESDIAPRNTGDGLLLSNDVTLVRQFVVGLVTPAPGFNEFQRADAAPIGTRGDGLLTAGDTIQARRYAAGLDAPQGAGGAIADPTLDLAAFAGGTFFGEKARTMNAGSATAATGSRVSVDIELDAQGDEAATSFTLNFDPGNLGNPEVTLAAGVPSDTILTANTGEEGKVTVLVDSGQSFERRAGKVVTVTFDVAQNAASGETPITFSNPSISDARANDLPASYQNGSITISNASNVEISGRVLTPEGRGLRNATVTITDQNGVTQRATTTSFGYYRFDGLEAGETFTVTVSSKRYRFAPRTLAVTGTLSDVDMIGMD